MRMVREAACEARQRKSLAACGSRAGSSGGVSNYIVAADAGTFLTAMRDESVDLFLIDPPYFNEVRDLWGRSWESVEQYSEWLVDLLTLARKKSKPSGSLIMFQSLGKHGQHPLFDIIKGAEKNHWFYRNWITWKKTNVFGAKDNYASARDEIVWFSASEAKAEFTFNEQRLAERNKRPIKNEFKKMSNVWSDIDQVLRPERACRRPLPLVARLIKVHSNPGELVVDFFSGFGTTGIVAHNLGRRFQGCEAIEEDAIAADRRVTAAR